MRSHTLLLNCCYLGNKNQFLRYSTKQTHIYTLFSGWLARDEHLNQSLLTWFITWGTKLFLNLFFLHLVHHHHLWDGRRSVGGWVGGWLGGWAGSLATACAFLTIAHSVSWETGCVVRPKILEAVLQMQRSIFLFETDIAGKEQILQFVNTDSIIFMYNNSRSLGSTWNDLSFLNRYSTTYLKVSITSTASPPILSGPSNWPLVRKSMQSSFVLDTFCTRKFSLHHTEIIETMFS